jgi:DNA-binding transcriptional regulator YiaG
MKSKRQLDLELAKELDLKRVITPEVFKFMRRSLRFSVENLAGMLSVTAKTIDGWENGEEPLDKNAVEFLSTVIRLEATR